MATTVNRDSILDSVKKSLNVDVAVTDFDSDIILLINDALSVLQQLGVGPEEGMSIEDSTSTWDELYEDPRLDGARKFVFQKCRLAFDPPQASMLSALQDQIRETEWRLTVASEEVKKSAE